MNPKRATEGNHKIKHIKFMQNVYNGKELITNGLENENIIQTMSDVMGMSRGEEEGTGDDKISSPNSPQTYTNLP